MKQPATEKIDPLIRIQEEIKEVARREQEYRQLTSTISPNSSDDFDKHHDDSNSNNNDSNNDNTNISIISNDASNDNDNHDLSINSVPSVMTTTATTADVTSLIDHEDSPSNTSSLALSVNSKECPDEHHSDDSGISASSSPINCTSENGNNVNETVLKTPSTVNLKEQRYIGPNCYNMTPEPPQQKLMTRTLSTPHLSVTTKPRQFTFTPAHKGVMQRFIASRGKLQMKNSNINDASNTILLNSRNATALMNANASLTSATTPNTPIMSAINTGMMPDFNVRNATSIVMPTETMTPAVIERDAEGRPIRPGYIPVELKIQRELKDLKSRESELKKIRKIRQSTPDLLDSYENDMAHLNDDVDDDDDSEIEHCYGPGKLRSAKSISELCDTEHVQSISMSPRATPSPSFDSKLHFNRIGNGGMRPAMSLAELCDLDPENAPSSHRLIAQWESLIQQNA